jgi:hypothetical protein
MARDDDKVHVAPNPRAARRQVGRTPGHARAGGAHRPAPTAAQVTRFATIRPLNLAMPTIARPSRVHRATTRDRRPPHRSALMPRPGRHVRARPPVSTPDVLTRQMRLAHLHERPRIAVEMIDPRALVTSWSRMSRHSPSSAEVRRTGAAAIDPGHGTRRHPLAPAATGCRIVQVPPPTRQDQGESAG